jgi:hypothetical protein
VTMALKSALFAKPIAVVPGMMGIAPAFRVRSASYGGQIALQTSADAVAPPILRAGRAKIGKTRRFEITCSALAKLGRIVRAV